MASRLGRVPRLDPTLHHIEGITLKTDDRSTRMEGEIIMHESKRERTTLEVPAERRTLILKVGEPVSIAPGGIFKLVEVLNVHDQRMVAEITTPTDEEEFQEIHCGFTGE